MWCRSEKKGKKTANVSAFGDTNIIIIVRGRVREILQHFILFAFNFFLAFFIYACVFALDQKYNVLFCSGKMASCGT